MCYATLISDWLLSGHYQSLWSKHIKPIIEFLSESPVCKARKQGNSDVLIMSVQF